ncbi:TPA: lipopolysaccharide biosynthesis protein [Vibrio alginolyticus]|uniref:lipopolysaccharide biosynthesis protein n=1 Tax=Vibrio TaxID=662 RepID=UPI0000D5530B|nr:MULTISPECIES: lipopolysaccharide biosynthesis protein [Vibrio]EAS75362.1 Polysaccharide biosynthesis protein [Vibrio alginolyticus 12G01]NNN66172.1 lipopolysaccharide biosynthesis protein [Vibrio sp. 2-1(7)]
MKKKIKVITSYTSIGANIALGFFLMYIINMFASVYEYGQFMILKSTSGLLSGILTFRSGEAVTKFYNTYKVEKENGKSKYILYIGFLSDLFISTFCLVLILTISFLFEQGVATWEGLDVKSFTLFGLVSVFTLLRGTSIGYLQAEGKITTINIINIIECFLISFFVFCFILINHSLDIMDIVYSHVFSYSIVTFIYLYILSLNYFFRLRFNKEKSKSTLLDYFKFSAITFGSSTLKSFNRNSDNIIIAYILSPAEVGFYQSIKKVFSITEIIAQPWSMLTYGRLITLYTKNEITKFKALIMRTTAYVFLLSLLTSVIIFAFLDNIFSFMKVEPLDSFHSVSIIVFISYLILAYSWWARVFSNVIDPMISVKANVFALLITVFILPITTLYLGLVGVGISFMLINIGVAIYISYRFNRVKF